MAMNATQVALNVKGVDKTGGIFRRIAMSAASVGRSVSMIGGATFGVAAGGFALAARELGKLSDVAMQAGVSAKELTQMATAMNVLGVKTQTPEQLATAFQKMAKAVGQTGREGLFKTIEAISQLGSVEERSAAAMAVFGKSGLDFMPLIEGAAKNGIASLEAVANAMPGISDAAANAGDACADAMGISADGAKAVWYEAIGGIAAAFDEQFEGGVREAAIRGAAYLEYAAAVAWVGFRTSAENVGAALAAVTNDWGETFSQVFNWLGSAIAASCRFMWEQLKNIGAVIRDFAKEIWSLLSGDGFSWDNVVKNANFGEVAEQAKAEFRRANQDFTLFDGVDWSSAANGIADADVKLREKLVNAAEAARAVGKAAVGFSAQEGAESTLDRIKTAMKAAKNEFLEGGSYKAATMSLRADYGDRNDRTARAVNAVKAVNEKILRATESTASALAGIGTV